MADFAKRMADFGKPIPDTAKQSPAWFEGEADSAKAGPARWGTNAATLKGLENFEKPASASVVVKKIGEP